MLYAILAVLVAVLGLMFLVYKRLEEVLKEVRIPTIKRAQDLPELKARLKSLQRPESRDAAPRQENRDERRDGNRESRGERRDGNRDGRGERRDGNRDGRGERPAEAPAVSESAAPAATPVVESPVSAAPAPVVTSGRRPLVPNAAAATEAPAASAPAVDVLAAASLAQEAPEAPIRHGRRVLPKARPNLDDVQLDEEKESV